MLALSTGSKPLRTHPAWMVKHQGATKMDVDNSRIMQINHYVTLYNMTILYSIQTLQFLFHMKSKKYQVVLSTPSN